MEYQSYWWSGPIGGLGNRLIAIAAVKACLHEQKLNFPWLNDPSCPGDFEDILDPIPNLQVAAKASPGDIPLTTHNWEPLSIFAQLKKDLDLTLTQSEFCLRFVDVLRQLPFKNELKDEANQWRQSNEYRPMIGVHIRRTDRMAQHRTEFRRVMMRKQGFSREIPLFSSAVYGVFPPAIISFYENWSLGSKLKKIKAGHKKFGFSIFSDNHKYVDGAKRVANWRGVESARYFTAAPVSADILNTVGLEHRQTGLVGAVIDLLSLASCDGIVQNNRASTFSLVASIIGMTPIISEKTNYPFWHAIENASVEALNGEGLSAQVIGGEL